MHCIKYNKNDELRLHGNELFNFYFLQCHPAVTLLFKALIIRRRRSKNGGIDGKMVGRKTCSSKLENKFQLANLTCRLYVHAHTHRVVANMLCTVKGE